MNPLGRVEIAGPDEHCVGRMNRARVEQHPKRHAPEVSAGRALRRVQVSVRVEPDDGKPLVARRQAFDRADMRAAATAEHDRSLGESGCQRQALLRDRVLLDDRRLRVGKLEIRGLRHCLAARPPRARHSNETGRECAPAGMTFVLTGVESDGGESPAVWALGPKARHRLPGYPDAGSTDRIRSSASGSSARSVSSASRGRSLASCKRLIQTAGMPSSCAGAMSWKRLAAT